VLGKETCHDDFTLLFSTSVVAITAVELLGHPLGKGSFMSLDGRQLLGVLAHVLGQSVS
jgi:hypothetical protein